MQGLIDALNIFLKYKNSDFPTHCEHDVMMIMDIERDEVSSTDINTLENLGFWWDEQYDCFASYRYGSA